uniref:Uncharacterized protein n=1 Tax=Amphimedon queenslandica TaxID=400682 RepID=A0A1X7TCD6_AMPQE
RIFRLIFRHSVCKATHWTETFIATEKWIPKLNQYKCKKVNHKNTEPFTPLLIER